MMRLEFKFTVTEFHLIFVFILGLHSGLMVLESEQTSYIVDLKKDEELKKIAVKRKTQSEEDAEALAGERFVRKPFVITYLGNVKVKKYSELLTLLNTRFSKELPKVSVASSSVGFKKGVEIQVADDHSVEFKISDSQKKNLIKRLIREKLSGVDICKRRHLLEDEFLMGTIKVNMKIKVSANLAVPKFQGHGNRKVISSLESCVKGQLVSMSFPSELADEEVTFDLKVN